MLNLLEPSRYVTGNQRQNLEDAAVILKLDPERKHNDTELSGMMEGLYIKIEEVGGITIMDFVQTGKFISLILRHKPETIGITLDEHGWADVKELIAGVQKTRPDFNLEILEEIVRTNNKQRYSFNNDHTKIRANQGHSIQVDVELKEAVPPEILYHGTGKKSVASILEQGLVPRSRLYVHLSKDKQTALNVGSRHGKPIVFTIQAGMMHEDGYKFFISENGIWLTKAVLPKYLKMES